MDLPLQPLACGVAGFFGAVIFWVVLTAIVNGDPEIVAATIFGLSFGAVLGGICHVVETQ